MPMHCIAGLLDGQQTQSIGIVKCYRYWLISFGVRLHPKKNLEDVRLEARRYKGGVVPGDMFLFLSQLHKKLQALQTTTTLQLKRRTLSSGDKFNNTFSNCE